MAKLAWDVAIALGQWLLFRAACRVLDHMDRTATPGYTDWCGQRIDA